PPRSTLFPYTTLFRSTLIRDQYASVGAAARSALPTAGRALASAAARGMDVGRLKSLVARRTDQMEEFSHVYRRYSWDTDGITGRSEEHTSELQSRFDL